MGATGFVDACGFIPASSGTGDFVVSAAIQGYQTPASASAGNGVVYSYRAESADKSQWEEGFGAYTVSGTTLARTTVTANSAGTTAKIAFSAAPNVFITAASADLQNAALLTSGTLPAARIAFAAKTDQQTGTSSTLPVAPAHMQDHDGVAKAWAYITYSGSTPTLQASYNVASISVVGTGVLDITFTNAFASANFASISGYGPPPTSNTSVSQSAVPQSASVVRITHRENAVVADPSSLNIACFGRQ